MTPKAKKIYKLLESYNHTGIRVWFENYGMSFEMCGMSGGYFFTSNQCPDIEPIGYSCEEALDYIKRSQWYHYETN